jgi:integrase/recombinase XerD
MSTPLEARRSPVRIPRLRNPDAAPKGELRDLKERYLAWLVSTGYAEATVVGAHSDLEWLLRYLDSRGVARAADVTREVLENYAVWVRERQNAYHEHRAVSLAQVLHRLNTVKSFCRWLVKNMVLLQDPAEDLELPRMQPKLPLTILTQEEARKILSVPDLRLPVGYRNKAMLELLYATGLRSRELFRLRVSDLDFKARTVFVRQGKGNKDRLLAAPAEAMGYVREYVEKVRPRFASRARNRDDGTLFLNSTGAKVQKGTLCLIVREHAKAAGLSKRVMPMTFRHSIASHLLENGMNVRFIQEFLGHSRLDTTQVYAKVTLTGLLKHYNKHHPREKRFRGAAAEAAK